MFSLSLSPRWDLFRFSFPKDFLPEPINDKYMNVLSKNAGVIVTPIDYLNESIQSISIPGISDINIQQQQHSTNSIVRSNIPGKKVINTEPKTDITYTSSNNPLDKIEKEFRVKFRLNQGLFNYYMLYETIFYRICKPLDYGPDKVLDFYNRTDDSKKFFASQFRKVFGKSLTDTWNEWQISADDPE